MRSKGKDLGFEIPRFFIRFIPDQSKRIGSIYENSLLPLKEKVNMGILN
jgi:hypothetical protein